MDVSPLLLVSLGGVFLALAALLVFVLAPASPSRQAVDRSLQLVQHMNRKYDAVGLEEASFLDRVLVPSLHRIAGLAERMSSRGYLDWMSRALDRAGNPPRWNVQRVLGAKAAGLIGLGALGLLFGTQVGPVGFVVATAAGAAAGFYLPDVLLYNAGLKHQDEIRKSLSEVIDMLTVCVEAGLGFDSALNQVAANTEGALAREITRVLQSLQIGTARTEALEALSNRSTVPELQAFVTAIVQADGLGIPIADILREQAKEMRTKRRQMAEEKAQKVPVKILFPMLIFIFPALMIVVVGPGAIDIYHAFKD